MKKFNYILLFVFFSATFYLISQSLTFDANTGDTVLDEKLKNLNAQAVADISTFKMEIASEFQTTEFKISKLLEEMEPAEVLFSYNIALINSISVDDVISVYKENKDYGWSVIINKLGISQQSEKFKDLKNISIYGKPDSIFNTEISQNK